MDTKSRKGRLELRSGERSLECFVTDCHSDYWVGDRHGEHERKARRPFQAMGAGNDNGGRERKDPFLTTAKTCPLGNISCHEMEVFDVVGRPRPDFGKPKKAVHPHLIRNALLGVSGFMAATRERPQKSCGPACHNGRD